MANALVLNATFEPLHIVSWQKALQLLYQGKVEVIEESDKVVRTVSLEVRVPAVLRLLSYVPLKRKKHWVRFSRSNIFIRDKNSCQYCGVQFPKAQLTLDHVVPSVQNGPKTWQNIVTACKPCNQRKGGRTPREAGMVLINEPKQPNWLPSTTLRLGLTVSTEQWKVYLKIEDDDDEGPDSF
jgi:5-methylcytosine-specific restriction endonuclease McrA